MNWSSSKPHSDGRAGEAASSGKRSNEKPPRYATHYRPMQCQRGGQGESKLRGKSAVRSAVRRRRARVPSGVERCRATTTANDASRYCSWHRACATSALTIHTHAHTLSSAPSCPLAAESALLTFALVASVMGSTAYASGGRCGHAQRSGPARATALRTRACDRRPPARSRRAALFHRHRPHGHRPSVRGDGCERCVALRAVRGRERRPCRPPPANGRLATVVAHPRSPRCSGHGRGTRRCDSPISSRGVHLAVRTEARHERARAQHRRPHIFCTRGCAGGGSGSEQPPCIPFTGRFLILAPQSLACREAPIVYRLNS